MDLQGLLKAFLLRKLPYLILILGLAWLISAFTRYIWPETGYRGFLFLLSLITAMMLTERLSSRK